MIHLLTLFFKFKIASAKEWFDDKLKFFVVKKYTSSTFFDKFHKLLILFYISVYWLAADSKFYIVTVASSWMNEKVSSFSPFSGILTKKLAMNVYVTYGSRKAL